MRSGERRKRPSRVIYWIVALALAAVLLYFSLRGIQWRAVGQVLLHADLRFVALGLAISSFALLMRALRWRILLRSGAPVGVGTAFWATAAGYLGNNFLPARAGELVRTVYVSKRTGLTKTFVLTTALSERLSDAIALVSISSIVLLTIAVRPGWFDKAARPFASVGLAGVIGIGLVPKLENVWRALLDRMPLPEGMRVKLNGILDQILTGTRTFHDRRRLGGFVGMTALIWSLDGMGTVIGMRALGLHLSLPVAFLLITGFGLGSALPSTPGYVGIYQFVAVSVLAPFGFAKADAIAYSFLAQAVQYVLITFWGLLGVTRYGGSLRAVEAEAMESA